MRRLALWAALLAAAIPMILGSPARGQSVEIIDFEDHPAGIDIDPAFYIDQGIRFEGGTVLEYGEGFASSGTNGLEMCFSEEFCTTPFRISFDLAQQSVSVFVGFNGRLGEAPPVLMVAFDANGRRLVDNDVVLEPGSPVPVRQLLQVRDPEGRIRAVEIRWSDASRFMNSLVIDDATFEPIFPVVLVSDPPELVLESESSEGMVVTNNGRGPVPFTVSLADDAGVFELLETTCSGTLAPGESCTLVVSFGPRAQGEYHASAVLLDRNGAQLLAIPIIGHEAPVATTTTPPSTTLTTTSSATTTSSTTATVSPSSTTTPTAPPTTSSASTATASTSTATSSTTVPTTQPRSESTTVGGLTRQVPLATSIIVAISGVFLLARRRRRAHPRARHLDSTTRISATVRVIPDHGSHQITTDDRQAVTAIRITTDPGGVTSSLVEVKSS